MKKVDYSSTINLLPQIYFTEYQSTLDLDNIKSLIDIEETQLVITILLNIDMQFRRTVELYYALFDNKEPTTM